MANLNSNSECPKPTNHTPGVQFQYVNEQERLLNPKSRLRTAVRSHARRHFLSTRQFLNARLVQHRRLEKAKEPRSIPSSRKDESNGASYSTDSGNSTCDLEGENHCLSIATKQNEIQEISVACPNRPRIEQIKKRPRNPLSSAYTKPLWFNVPAFSCSYKD